MHKLLILAVLGLLVASTLSVGTGGFTAGQITRPATIDIVSDDRAALGYDARCRSDDLLVTVTNRVPEIELELSVSVAGVVQRATVDPLTAETVRVGTVDPGSPITVRAYTEDGGFVIELDRSVPGECRNEHAIDWIAFCGPQPTASPAVAATDDDGPVAARWTDTGDGSVVYKAGPTVYDAADDGTLRSGEGMVLGSGGSLAADPCAAVTGSSGTTFEYNASTGAFEPDD